MRTGEALREARLQRGLDLYEVHRVTKIPVHTLRAMEEDRWAEVPEAEGRLAAYAGFLGVEDPGPIERGAGEPAAHWRPPGVLLAVGFAALVGVIIGLVAIGPLGGSDGGKKETETANSGATPQTTTRTVSSPVSVEISTHALVWVCLVDQRGQPVINGLNLLRDQSAGPYDGRSFDVTFGNGKVDLTVNGQPVDVPNIAAPFGYRITPEGAMRLRPSDQPTCT